MSLKKKTDEVEGNGQEKENDQGRKGLEVEGFREGKGQERKVKGRARQGKKRNGKERIQERI